MNFLPTGLANEADHKELKEVVMRFDNMIYSCNAIANRNKVTMDAAKLDTMAIDSSFSNLVEPSNSFDVRIVNTAYCLKSSETAKSFIYCEIVADVQC